MKKHSNYQEALSGISARYAAQGNAAAQHNLGLSVMAWRMDLIRAHIWFNIAAGQGIADVSKDRDDVAKRMTPAQIAKAQKMARQCLQSQYKECD